MERVAWVTTSKTLTLMCTQIGVHPDKVVCLHTNFCALHTDLCAPAHKLELG